MSFRLLPKDVQFFDLFVADGENLEAAATRLHEMVTEYDRPRPARRRDPAPREGRRRDRPRDHPAARGCLRHAVRPRGHPRADGPARRRRRRHPGDRRDVRDLRHRPADRGGPRAHPHPRRPGASSCSRPCASSTGSRTSTPTSSAVHDLEHEADALSRAAVGAAVPRGHRPARGHQVARPVPRARERHRRRRGRRRGHRADVPQGDLTTEPALSRAGCPAGPTRSPGRVRASPAPASASRRRPADGVTARSDRRWRSGDRRRCPASRTGTTTPSASRLRTGASWRRMTGRPARRKTMSTSARSCAAPR